MRPTDFSPRIAGALAVTGFAVFAVVTGMNVPAAGESSDGCNLSRAERAAAPFPGPARAGSETSSLAA